jgi:hypothetical protein
MIEIKATDRERVGTILRLVICTAAASAILTASASAQMPMPGFSLHDDAPKRTPEEQEHDKAIDDAYRSASKKIPDKQPADPWGGVRQSQPAPAPSTKKTQSQQ